MPVYLWLLLLVSLLVYLFFGNPLRHYFRRGSPGRISDLSSRRPRRIVGRVCRVEKTLTAPLSGRPCLAWTLKIQRAENLDDQTLSTRWDTIQYEEDKVDFVIEDGLDRAWVLMEVVDLDLATTNSGMTSLLGALPEERRAWLESRAQTGLVEDPLGLRLVERLLAEGERVAITGVHHGTRNGIKVVAHPENGPMKVVSLPGYVEE